LFGKPNAIPLAIQQRLGVAVSNGIFTVRLDFGGNFNGQPRLIEIAVRPAGSQDPFTVLSPLQPITSAPYSIRSLNAAAADTAANSTQLGGVTADQYVQTVDTRLSDDRNPLPNSPNYINNTTAPQVSSNFNISGTGTAGILDAVNQYNLGGLRAISAPGNFNFFAGLSAGRDNSTGIGNSFFGISSGKIIRPAAIILTSASVQVIRIPQAVSNAFFGSNAGRSIPQT
jgi:hypothetical protein